MPTVNWTGPIGEGALLEVTSATANIDERAAIIGTSDGHLYKIPMSEEEIDDYKNHPEAYWGKFKSMQIESVKLPMSCLRFYYRSTKILRR